MTFWLKIREPVLSTFIIFNVIAIAIILIPGISGQDSLKKPFLPYLFATGLFQGKGVFVPRPHVYEVRLSAEVYFEDGSKVDWKNVDMQDLNLNERYHKERFRRWGRLNTDTNSPLRWWEGTARWIARQCIHDGKVPVQVILMRDRIDTPAPNSSNSPAQIHEAIFKYKLTPEDLQAAKPATDTESGGTQK